VQAVASQIDALIWARGLSPGAPWRRGRCHWRGGRARGGQQRADRTPGQSHQHCAPRPSLREGAGQSIKPLLRPGQSFRGL